MKKFGSIASMLVAAFALAACTDSPTGDEAGAVSMLITDAPGDFTTAIVTIERIELLRSDEAEDDSSGEADNRIVLRDEPWTGDLLELANDVDEIVSEVTVPGGSYSQIRFVISGGCIGVEAEDGSATVYASDDDYTACGAIDGDLQMPSMRSSGLKVHLPSGFEVSGDDRIVLIDFDVAESFGHEAGNSGKWVMHPSIHATEVVMSGSLDVNVVVADSIDLPRTLTADSFMVRLDDEPAVAVTAGVASFEWLVPGTYSVSLVAPDSVTITTDPALPLVVEVGSSDDENATITITSAL